MLSAVALPAETHSIVIVDDVPEIREILGFLLEESGWFSVVGEAGTADEALAITDRTRPELLLLDLDLPGTSGSEILPLLRERYPATAVVVLAGSIEDLAPVRDDVDRHATAIFDKGLSGQQLIPRLLEVLGRNRVGPRESTADHVARRVETLDDADAWLAAIVNSAPYAIIGKTLEGTIVSWNDAATKLYGYTAEEVVGRSIGVIVPADRPDELDKILAVVAKGERITGYDTVRVHKDGSRLDIHLTVTPVIGSDGSVVGASTIARDMSARRHTEAALARAVAQLERRNRDLARSNEELDSCASVASHDLAQPLQVAYGFLDMLRADYGQQLPAQGQEWLGHSLASLERMRELVRDILRYSRSGSGEVRRERVELSTVVEDALGALALAAGARNARIEVTPDLPAVVGDGGQLSLVLQNLLANAIKFVPDGRAPLVRVAAQTAGADVVLRVVDNGIGIEAGDRTKVFDMFHRASPAEFAGTGLGLAIVKKIVARHGGGVWIEDAPAATGTTVCLRLPAAPGGE